MKILFFLHQLDIGGTLVNAIEPAAALRDFHSHDVAIFATPGPMLKLIEGKGLRFLSAPIARFNPCPERMRALRAAVRTERPDLVYAWESWPCIDAYYAVHLPMHVPLAVTDMLMYLTRLLPKELPTTFGTPELVDMARVTGRRRVELLLPPVDVRLNAPGAVEGAAFRQQYGIGANETLLVIVSRLVEHLKGESLVASIDAMGEMGRDLPVRLVIVGDGDLRPQLEEMGNKVNSELRRSAVTFTGALIDPRPAYAAADLVIGMGGSALRGMAFAKPVIIAGEQGFSAPLTPDTADFFYYKGIYGQGVAPSNETLSAVIRNLLCSKELGQLGEFSREFVTRNFSLDTVSAALARFCQAAVAEPPDLWLGAANAFRTAAVYLRERKFLIRSRPPVPLEG